MTDHDVASAGLEIELYIPNAVWGLPATHAFVSGLSRLAEGATVFGGAKGVWQGEQEGVTVVRLLVRVGDHATDELHRRLRTMIEDVMRQWNLDPATRQETFLFTSRSIQINEVTANGDD